MNEQPPDELAEYLKTATPAERRRAEILIFEMIGRQLQRRISADIQRAKPRRADH